MSELQVYLANTLANLLELLPLGYAFGAGAVSTVNPCGFALLPVYLALFLGAREEGFAEQGAPRRAARAVGVAVVVTAGFVALFGVAGLAIAAGGRFLLGVMPWLAVAIGVALALLGLWTLAGRQAGASVFARLASRIGQPAEPGVRGFFVFGVAFGAASLSCTLPIFLVVAGTALAAPSLAGAALPFASYALGMGTVLAALTLAIALLREGLVVGGLRRALPYFHTVSGVMLVLGGGYIVYYWLFTGGLLAGP